MRGPALKNLCLRCGFWLSLSTLVIGAVSCTGATLTPSRPTGLPTFSVALPPTPSVPTVVSPAVTATAATPESLPTVLLTTTIEATVTHTPTTERGRATATRSPAPGVSGTGRIAYTVVTGTAPKLHTIWVANLDGTGAHQILESASWPAFSPDGKRIVFYQLSVGVTNPGLYVADGNGGNPKPVHLNSGVCCQSWSHDGNWVVYAISPRPSRPGGPITMVKMDGLYKTITDLKVQGNGPSLSPDGKQIVFSSCLPNTNTCGVLIAPTDGSGVVKSVTTDNGGNAHWSPRGDKIVYQGTDAAGHHQVYVVNPDGSGKKQLTSGKSNDGQPAWSPDGGSIFWRSDQNGTGWAVYRMNADGSNPRRIIPNVAPDQDLWAWESLSVAP